MYDPAAIFQRTQAGRDEIHNKSHGLTQSERLVLIMIDGVTSCANVKGKLSSLTDERFIRALATLQKKDLILEVFLPVEGQAAEVIESEVADRFLQQDPLDPVTIIFVDPEEELGLLQRVSVIKHANGTLPSVEPIVPIAQPAATQVTDPHAEEPVDLDAAFDEIAEIAKLADAVEKEVRARQSSRHLRPPQALERPDRLRVKPVFQPAERPVMKGIHWGYWMIGLGSAFIVGFFISHFGR